MLLPSKNPQPMPKRTREAIAREKELRLVEFPTPKSAGMIRSMPRALTWIRPRSDRRIQRSASHPPPTAATIAADCQYRVAETPAMPWLMLKLFWRIAGIQSRTTHPARAGSVKYNTSRMNEPLVRSSDTTAMGEADPARGVPALQRWVPREFGGYGRATRVSTTHI